VSSLLRGMTVAVTGEVNSTGSVGTATVHHLMQCVFSTVSCNCI